jgi:glycosyltransferase involved in cell wall biosynthesis
VIKIIHLVPFDGVGGVEVAAKSIHDDMNEDFRLEVEYIFTNVQLPDSYWATLNPLKLLTVARRIASSDAEILVVSLWRSSVVGLIAKLISPKLNLVTFIHLDRSVHIFDAVFTKLSLLNSVEVWADSKTTLEKRFANLNSTNSRVISFVIERYDSLSKKNVRPAFIFWGRICQQKNIVRAIHLFERILKIRSDATFTIIGPDAGELSSIKQLCSSLGLTESIVFKGEASHDEIMKYASHASFYLQTSLAEGMAMSVVEAMQFGLVPVVSPVGEIASYCKNEFNSVLIFDDKQAIRTISSLLNDNSRYQKMRKNAIRTWIDKPLYRQSILLACKDVIRNLRLR